MKNLSTEKQEERGVGSRMAMSVKKVIESPENHEEGLTRRGRGLESITADCGEKKKWEREAQTNGKGRRSEG